MAFTILRLLCGVGILAALIGAGLWLLNRERQRLDEQAETHEDLDASLGAALASLLVQRGAVVRVAMTPKKGAVHIDFPNDLSKAEASGLGNAVGAQEFWPEVAAKCLKSGLERISRAKRPVALVGLGITAAAGGVYGQLKTFVEKFNIPTTKGPLP